MWATLSEAYNRTRADVAKLIYQTMLWINDVAPYVQFRLLGGEFEKTYYRRKKDNEVAGQWGRPGQHVSPLDNPKVLQVTTRLFEHIAQPKIPTATYYNGRGLYSDPFGEQVYQALLDVSKGLWRSMMVGQYVDRADFTGQGSLPASFLASAITPGVCNFPYRGTGQLQYKNSTQEVQFRAPGDTDFGDPVKAVTGQDVLLYSAYSWAWIKFTVGTLPGSDADTQILFTSTNEQPDGLLVLIDPSQTKDSGTNGDDISFEILDDLEEQLGEPYRHDPMSAYIMRTRHLNKLKSLARSMGGATIDDMLFTPPGAQAGTGKRIPVYNGHPILCCDHLPITSKGTSAKTSDVLICNFNPKVLDGQVAPSDVKEPLGGFFGLASGSAEGEVYQSEYGMGFFIGDIGQLEAETSVAKRMLWYGGWGIGSVLAAARKKNVRN